MEADLQADFFTEGSNSALKAVFASWSLERCRHWWVDGMLQRAAYALHMHTCRWMASRSMCLMSRRMLQRVSRALRMHTCTNAHIALML